jgi:EpsI family protein
VIDHLGVLYAYLTYTKTWKRLLFVVVSIIVPVLANGLRAYLIVIIAHMSDMKLAVGVDHLIYGWVFFGIVITILFFVGSFWRDPPPEDRQQPASTPGQRTAVGALVIAVAAVLIAGLWPGLAWTLERGESDTREILLQMPEPLGSWGAQQGSLWGWRPNVVGADGELYGFYISDKGTPVGLYLGVYRSQRQGAELLSSQNQMVLQKHPVWRDNEQTVRQIRLRGDEVGVNQSRLASRDEQRLLVWSWFRIGDHHTANPYLGKVLEAVYRLFGQRRDGSLIAIAAPYEDEMAPAAQALQTFANQMLPSIDRALDRALRLSP